MTVAALYVQTGGCYFGLPDVDPWDEQRDARLYAGPHPVVAHPPCARWGSYWFGSPSGGPRFELGGDGGCFEAALASVRRFGGALEHPARSKAWDWFGIGRPTVGGGWQATLCGGWTCQVDQGHYGHRAAKPTWLYVHGARTPPELVWGRALGKTAKIDIGARSKEERARIIRRGQVELLSKRERAATPIEFRDVLLSIARSCHSTARA